MLRLQNIAIFLLLLARTLSVPLRKHLSKEALDKSAADIIIKTNKDADATSRLFEGDIQLEPEDLEFLHQTSRMNKRNAQRMRQGLWRTKVIPYEIHSSLESEGFREPIEAAIKELHKHTCIRWVPRTAEKPWVKFVKGKTCSSRVGRKYWSDDYQEIILTSNCKHQGTILHEMMHATGFWHEQSRPDRDQYVEIMWENIEPGQESNFKKYSHPEIDNLGTQYDYRSVMHYGRLSFTSNDKPTIQAIGNKDMELGQRDGLSDVDIIKLNALYDCKSPSGGWSSWSSFSPCSDACQKYRQRYCTAVDTNECPGADYYGIQTKSVKCSSQECYVHIDGHWSKWSQWSQCSATCDKGIHTRTRVCNDPAPKRGGKACKGSAVDKKVCTRKSCDLGQDDCQFDSDMWCHWTQDKTDTNPWDWQRISGPTQTFGTGPSGDHTSGSGFYIYSEASGPATTGNTASLLSRAFPPSSSRCMTFWYSMNGAGVGNLRVYVKNIGTSNLEMVWDKQGNQGSEWMKGQVDIHSSTEYKVVLEAVRGPTFQGDIGLDDITFTNGRCGASHPSTSLPLTTTSTTSTSPSTTGLPFTITTSSIYQTITLSLTTDMSSLATSTSSPETDTSSPTTDTSSTISTSSPIANKSSPSTSASSTTSTSSPTTDTSSQTASTTSTISSSSPIASKASPSTSAPFPTTIPSSPIPSTSSRTSNTTSPTTASSPKITNSLPPNTVSSESATSSPPKATTSFQPAISTTTSSSGTAASSPRTMTTSSKTTAGNPQTSSQFPTATSSSQTAAVETTEVHNSAVHTTTVATTAAQTTKSTMTITTEPAIIDDFCDFGSLRPTFCTWSNDPTNSVASGGYVFDWWWMKLPTPSRNTGPSRDHTTGKGYYIYLESSTPFETGNKARLLSRQYQSSTVVCLSFWYHMFGETIGSLRVYIDVQEKERQRVWEKSGNQGNTWKMARVSIMNKSSFRIVLEGERGPSYYGDIGLDDVTVKSGECEP